MSTLGKLLFLPVAVIVVLFAVANRETVTVSLWPLPYDVDMPMYAAVLGALAVGIVIGATASWFSAGRFRRRARTESQKAKSLERELLASENQRKSADAELAGSPAGPRSPAVLDDD